MDNLILRYQSSVAVSTNCRFRAPILKLSKNIFISLENIIDYKVKYLLKRMYKYATKLPVIKIHISTFITVLLAIKHHLTALNCLC